jgi:hypothetical protein
MSLPVQSSLFKEDNGSKEVDSKGDILISEYGQPEC